MTREVHDYLFGKAVEGMTAEEVLNYYRNLYHAEPNSTEHGIVANALNEILPRMILPPCKVGDTVYVLFGEPSRTIKEFRVRSIVFAEIHDSIGFTNKSMFTIWDKRWYDFFGKIIFTTREEAEQALKGEHHAEIH